MAKKEEKKKRQYEKVWAQVGWCWFWAQTDSSIFVSCLFKGRTQNYRKTRWKKKRNRETRRWKNKYFANNIGKLVRKVVFIVTDWPVGCAHCKTDWPNHRHSLLVFWFCLFNPGRFWDAVSSLTQGMVGNIGSLQINVLLGL